MFELFRPVRILTVKCDIFCTQFSIGDLDLGLYNGAGWESKQHSVSRTHCWRRERGDVWRQTELSDKPSHFRARGRRFSLTQPISIAFAIRSFLLNESTRMIIRTRFCHAHNAPARDKTRDAVAHVRFYIHRSEKIKMQNLQINYKNKIGTTDKNFLLNTTTKMDDRKPRHYSL